MAWCKISNNSWFWRYVSYLLTLEIHLHFLVNNVKLNNNSSDLNISFGWHNGTVEVDVKEYIASNSEDETDKDVVGCGTWHDCFVLLFLLFYIYVSSIWTINQMLFYAFLVTQLSRFEMASNCCNSHVTWFQRPWLTYPAWKALSLLSIVKGAISEDSVESPHAHL